MAEPPQRPRFRDGQALAAADLELLVDHARNHDARHDRTLHTPGIALGLELASQNLPLTFNNQTVVTKQLTVKAGIADDGNGVQVVLAEDRTLPPTQFEDDIGRGEVDQQAGVPGATHLYPVLLVTDERDGPAPAFSPDGCGAATGPTRVVEDVQIRIGRRGEETTLAAQRALGPGETLTDAGLFRLLLGFVRFHAGLRRYVEVQPELNGIRPVRAGVRAAEVVTPHQRLLLRAGEPPAPGQPALALETEAGGQLRFGRSTPDGGIDPVLTVTLAGAVKLGVGATLDPGRVVGTARVQSGVATDGMPLPLPPGVTAKEVQEGKWALHLQVTPRFPAPLPATAFVVSRCEVDADRVVHCQLFRLAAGGAMTAIPGACNFLIVAAVVEPQAPGATP
jgi:hypothetical protein